MGPNGHVFITDEWGGYLLDISPGGAVTKLAAESNAGPSAVDNYGNVYFAADGYDGNIYKIPYNATAGTYTGFTTVPTATCLGGTQDTAPCLFAPNFQKVVFTNGQGYSDLVFDASGNLFIATSTVPSANGNSIYECNAACQTGSSGTPLLIYADANPIGALAVDPWGNLFFSDGNNNTGKTTQLNEIPYQAGKYASAPTVLESYTNKAGYGNGFSGVAVGGTGTVYFATNADGIFAIPNTASNGPSLAGAYAVATGGGYGIALDGPGNLYLVHYAGNPPSGAANYAVDRYLANNLSLGATTLGGTATTASIAILDSNGSCTPTLTLSANEFGVSSSEFTATAGSTCSAALGTSNGTITPALTLAGAVISATVTFNPAAVGMRNAALVIKDATNSASGTAALSGVGQGGWGNLDPGITTAFSTGLNSPASVVADSAGDLFVADSGAGKVYEIAQGSTTPVAIGSGFVNPTALAFDASGNLFIADDGLPGVEEIANIGTTGAFVAGTQWSVAGSQTTFGGTALGSAMGLAVGQAGALYISDPVNKRVVLYNPLTGQSGVTLANSSNGLSSPMGLAADSSGNLYVADSTLNQVLEFANAGGITAISPPNVTEAVGVAVDASGSVLVADAGTGSIVRIPNLGGTLTTSKAVTVETVSPQASSLWMDAQGDVYVASASGKAAYAIQRTAASINFGTVQDGVTNSGTVYLENAGNAAATLGTPDVTQSNNSMFTLNDAATNGCGSGSAGPAGAWCAFSATFAPPVGTANGVQSGAATINIATPALALTVNMAGTATQSSIKAQTITNFNPPSPIQVGQQIALSATGGGSGNPVTFTIDPSSACTACATISGNTLTAVSAGKIVVDANQAAGSNSGTQYAAAQQVQAAITVNNNLVPADVPALLMSQVLWSYQSGAFTDGQNPAGGSFAVTQNGQIVVGTSYNNKVDFVSASTGALMSQVAISGPGGLTIDKNNNLYMSHLYGPTVLKIPYVNGAYATLSDTAPPNCTGTDTTLCTFASVGSGGVKAIAFDPSGNLYMVTVPGSTGASAIYECPLSCQTGGTGTAIYSEANAISQIAFDPWGNLFFTDGVYANATNFSNDEASSSNLYELPYTAGTGFAATPTLLQTLTDAGGNLHSYDNQLDGVAVTANGTVYYATQNEGTFGIPNTQAGGPDIAHQFVVSTLGAKGMELDAQGNEWVVVYHSGGDNIGEAQINNLTTPIAQLQGAAVTASATVVDNAFSCGTAATLSIASSNPEFSATAGSTCSGVSPTFTTPVFASSYPATISFSATKGGPQTATLTMTDTANGGAGSATVTGVGQETPQTLTFTAPTTTTFTYAPGMTIGLSVSNGGSNNPAAFTVDSSSTGAGTISTTTLTGTTSSATLTVTQAGSIVIDANEIGGLVNGIYYNSAAQVQLTLTVNQAPQAIVFPQPTSPVTYSPTLTVALSANGGASGNAVAFAVDSSSTGAGTISTSTVSGGTSTATLAVTQAGIIVIDANQAGSTDYLAAPQVQQTVVVNQASQTISFIPLTQPFHYIAAGVTLSIQATGGGSDQPIVFTVDKSSTMAGSFSTSKVSGATSTTTLTMPASQTPTSGSIVVNATQPGNSNYAAATLTQETIAVLAPLPIQTITFPVPQTQVGGTTLTLTATSTSGFPVAYTSSASSVCTVSGSTATFAAVTSASTCTITASQPGDNLYFAAATPVSVSFTVNPPGKVPAMSLNVSLPSLTIEPGTVGLTQITIVSQNNFTGSVTFACSGLPSGYNCTFNPNPLNLPQGGSETTTLTVAPPASAAAVVHRDFTPLLPATLAAALCFIGFRKRNWLQLLLLMVVFFSAFGLVSGCGGTSGSSTPKAVTSTATVTATSGATQVTSTLTVILE